MNRDEYFATLKEQLETGQEVALPFTMTESQLRDLGFTNREEGELA